MENQTRIQQQGEDGNPLDSVEEILDENDWAYSRMNNDELIVRVSGKSCDYRLFFIWQSNMRALQFCCQYDMEIHKENIPIASAVLMDLNAALWMGHFEIDKESAIPCFRQTCLLRSCKEQSRSEYIEDLVDIALAQCEQYQAVFQILASGEAAHAESLSLALMETAGEA